MGENYVLVVDYDLQRLATTVEKHLKNGFIPTGGITIDEASWEAMLDGAKFAREITGRYIQAMYRPE